MNAYDVAVVGAGVFGAWTTYHCRRTGASVALLDAYGPGNSRASSGGESRILRMGYGPDELYTRSAQRSFEQWSDFLKQIDSEHSQISLLQPFHRTGVLWLAREGDRYSEATLSTLSKCGVSVEHFDYQILRERYPLLEIRSNFWGLLEPGSGVLMARQLVQKVVDHAIRLGTTYFQEKVLPPRTHHSLTALETPSGTIVRANKFVFACGPWLPKVFPELLGRLIHVTRQEVFFLGLPDHADDVRWRNMPVWLDFNDLVYAIPNVDGRGLKIAIDAHGPHFDPDEGDRMPTEAGISALRSYLAERVPSLKNQPILEARVCQYENTSNGDFLIDCHPDFKNVWLVGGGSGHGFKHGPAVGEYVTALLAGSGRVEQRFTLATKAEGRQRAVF